MYLPAPSGTGFNNSISQRPFEPHSTSTGSIHALKVRNPGLDTLLTLKFQLFEKTQFMPV